MVCELGITKRTEKFQVVLYTYELVRDNIPHFCYHSHLSIARNFRMCFVETGHGKVVVEKGNGSKQGRGLGSGYGVGSWSENGTDNSIIYGVGYS